MDHDHRPPLVPGLVLGALLGSGAHGSVWAARDPATDERVAVKVGRRPDDPHAGREAALLARLDHPHVVRLRNVVECPDGTRALVLALAEGGSLDGLVRRRGVLPVGETVTVVVGLARTLADLHAIGIVHGDLSPGNVLLGADGRPLVGDLGVAAVLGRQPDDGPDRWGTTGFADPAAGPADDPARDVHALGALLRYCLTGSADPSADPSAGPSHDPDAGAQLPDDARALLAVADLATAADPARRPDAAEVARLVWAAGAPEPVRLVGDAGASVGEADALAVPSAPRPGGTARRAAVAAAFAGRADRTDRASGPSSTDVTRRIRQEAKDRKDAEAEAERAAHAAREARRRRVVRRVRSVAVLVAAVGVGAVGGLAALHTLGPGAATSSGPDTTAPDPQTGAAEVPADVGAVVERLAASRATALRSASVDRLAAVDEPGSPAMAADAALVGRLVAARVRLAGLTFTVADVRIVGRTAGAVEVTARVTTSAHRQVRPDGRLVASVPGGPPRVVRLVLVPGPGAHHWRVRSATGG